MITHRNLAYLLKLAELGNFRRAAEALNISHAALVRSVKVTEEELGVRLFDRGAGVKVAPTEIGVFFLDRGREIHLLEVDLRQGIQEMIGLGRGELSIAMGPFPGKVSGHAAIGRMLGRYPNLRVKSTVLPYGPVVEAVLERAADLGFAECSQASALQGLDIEPLHPHPAYFICRPGHPLLRQGKLSVSDLMAYPWCTNRLPSRVGNVLPENPGRAGSFDPGSGEFVPAVLVDGIDEMIAIVSRSSDLLGLGTLPMFVSQLGIGKLVVVPFKEPWMVTGYGFLTLKHRNRSPAVAAFMDEARALEEESLREERELATKFLGERFPG